VRRRLAIIVVLFFGAGCEAGSCLLNALGDVAGETADARCDRRFVADGGDPVAFCQEIVDTLAAGAFQKDCREKHAAAASKGRCSRDNVLGGCKLHKQNDDGSDVWDWFYDVRALETDAGITFRDPPRTQGEVEAMCADPERYEEGATFFRE
jgi:hypothetical protein